MTNFALDAPFRYGPVPIGNQAYFVADDGVHGQELWRADGTAAVPLREL